MADDMRRLCGDRKAGRVTPFFLCMILSDLPSPAEAGFA